MKIRYYLKNSESKKGRGHYSSGRVPVWQHKVLSSNHSTAKKKKKVILNMKPVKDSKSPKRGCSLTKKQGTKFSYEHC
jgi:hypothetical protein